MEDNPIIKQRVEEKNKRLDKQADSILISWAINSAVNTLSEEMKRGEWAKVKDIVKDRYPWFIEQRKEWFDKQKYLNGGWSEERQNGYNEDSEVMEEARKLAETMNRKYISPAMIELARERLNK